MIIIYIWNTIVNSFHNSTDGFSAITKKKREKVLVITFVRSAYISFEMYNS